MLQMTVEKTLNFSASCIHHHNGNFLFPTNTTIHDDTHHSQLGMMGNLQVLIKMFLKIN